METKKCQYCKEEIIGKREDAKFCSNTCKAKHWEETKHSGKAPLLVAHEEKNVTHQLRAVLNGNDSERTNCTIGTRQLTEPVYQTEEVAIANPERVALNIENRRLTDVRKQLVSEIEKLKADIEQINQRNGNGWLVGLTGTGALVGNKTAENTTEGTLLGGVIGLVAGNAMKALTTNIREEDKKQQYEQIEKDILKRMSLIQQTDNALRAIEGKLKAIPFFSKEKKLVPVKIQKEQNAINPSYIPNTGEPLIPFTGMRTDVSDVSLTDTESDSIINSQKLKLMKFKSLPFQGKWNMFFGNPSFNFYCVLSGMPGEGKSTFAIQFAKYLADNVGRVIYISSEEGFSKTFNDKILNNNAESKYFDVADLKTFDDIIRKVAPETYNFIFIDSLDNMKIDIDKMKKIRKQYQNSAIITISQSTKDGQMRGSNELVHDCDIAVKVENGIATTKKNRFKERGMTYEVFGNKNIDAFKMNLNSHLL
jgi:hypothetical protein